MKIFAGDIIQLSVFLISLSVFAQKPVPLYLRLFPLYLFLLMIEDLVIEYTSPLGIHNNIIPNIGGIAEFAFYFFVIRSVIVNTNVKKRIYYVTLAFAVFAVIILLIHGNELFNPINFTVGTVITVVFCIYYFFELFQKTEAQSLSRLTSFWLVSGILFNAVLIFPIFALISFMDNISKANRKTTRIVFDHIETIFNMISVLTYILYSTGFIVRIRTGKSIR